MIQFLSSHFRSIDVQRDQFKNLFNECNSQLDRTSTALPSNMIQILDSMDNLDSENEILIYSYFSVLLGFKLAQVNSGVANVHPFTSMQTMVSHPFSKCLLNYV